MLGRSLRDSGCRGNDVHFLHFGIWVTGLETVPGKTRESVLDANLPERLPEGSKGDPAKRLGSD